MLNWKDLTHGKIYLNAYGVCNITIHKCPELVDRYAYSQLPGFYSIAQNMFNINSHEQIWADTHTNMLSRQWALSKVRRGKRNEMELWSAFQEPESGW